MNSQFLFCVLEKEKRQDISDSEDVVGERLQQDVVSRQLNYTCPIVHYICKRCT